MTRRTLLLAVPQAIIPQPPDQWQELAAAWNPFAEKYNRGIVDVKQWAKVLKQVHRIEGKSCKTS